MRYSLYVDYVGLDGIARKVVRAYNISIWNIIDILKIFDLDSCYRITISPELED